MDPFVGLAYPSAHESVKSIRSQIARFYSLDLPVWKITGLSKSKQGYKYTLTDCRCYYTFFQVTLFIITSVTKSHDPYGRVLKSLQTGRTFDGRAQRQGCLCPKSEMGGGPCGDGTASVAQQSGCGGPEMSKKEPRPSSGGAAASRPRSKAKSPLPDQPRS